MSLMYIRNVRWSTFHYPINKTKQLSEPGGQRISNYWVRNILQNHLSSIELYFAFLTEFFGWSLATLFLEKHDVNVSTKFSSSTKKPALRQFVPRASWLLSLFLIIAYVLTSYYHIQFCQDKFPWMFHLFQSTVEMRLSLRPKKVYKQTKAGNLRQYG